MIAAALRYALCALVVLATGHVQAFGFEDVARQAEALAAQPHKPAARETPRVLREMSYDRYRDIRFRPARALWRDAGLLSVVTSRASLGTRLRRAGVFLIPEESVPPPEIEATRRYTGSAGAPPSWIDAVVDPACNAMMAAFAIPRRSLPPAVREARLALVERVLAEGPAGLSEQEKNMVLGDRLALLELHRRVHDGITVHPAWRAALQATTAPAESAAPVT